MKLFLLIAVILVLSVISLKVLDIHSVSTPSPTIAMPTLTLPTSTDTPTPTFQQTAYFTTPLYCPQIYLQGVTPCVDRNKIAVACVAQYHPDGSPALNLICGIPGNSSSVKSCVSYTNNPSVISCF